MINSSVELAAEPMEGMLPRRSVVRGWLRSVRKRPLLVLCSLLTTAFIMVGLTAHQIAPHRPNAHKSAPAVQKNPAGLPAYMHISLFQTKVLPDDG